MGNRLTYTTVAQGEVVLKGQLVTLRPSVSRIDCQRTMSAASHLELKFISL